MVHWLYSRSAPSEVIGYNIHSPTDEGTGSEAFGQRQVSHNSARSVSVAASHVSSLLSNDVLALQWE